MGQAEASDLPSRQSRAVAAGPAVRTPKGEAVFVYGTCKRSLERHAWLQGARSLGRRRLPGARLHDFGSYPVVSPGKGMIHGELYAVASAHLHELDHLHGIDAGWHRLRCRLFDGSDAWIYTPREPSVPTRFVPLGDWGTTPMFSYGSNMDPQQLRRRCPDWDGTGLAAWVEGWNWELNKIARGERGHGAAGIHPQANGTCWGVVQHLSPADRRTLDRWEGVALDHYRRRIVMVRTTSGERFEALTYEPAPQHTGCGLQPTPAYARRILTGAAHFALPEAWQRRLRRKLGEL